MHTDDDGHYVVHLVRPAQTMTLSSCGEEHTVDSRMSPVYDVLVKIGTAPDKASDTVMCYGLALLESVEPLQVYMTLASIISYADVVNLADCEKVHDTVLQVAKGIKADVERLTA